MGIEPTTSVLQTDASPSRPQTLGPLCPIHQRLVNLSIPGRPAVGEWRSARNFSCSSVAIAIH